MVNLPEIIVVNGIGVCLIGFLFMTMTQKKETRLIMYKLFILMISITLVGCIVEVLSFLIDGKVFTGNIALSYIMNSFLFFGTVSIGFLWCIYVDLRVNNSSRGALKRAVWLAVPFAANSVLIFINLFGNGALFSVSPDNVYSRGRFVFVPYVILFFYFLYSIHIAHRRKKNTLRMTFFPVACFIVPCMIGTLLQGLMYGLTIGWTSVAIALMFVYTQTQYLDIYVDSLSGLNNRRYLDNLLSRLRAMPEAVFYGLMMDINDFKRINDVCGHSAGDRALSNIGNILYSCMPDNAVAIRYAGDEFIVLIHTDDENEAKQLIERIDNSMRVFNRNSNEPYTLSMSTGCCRFSAKDKSEDILSAMDAEMYSTLECTPKDNGSGLFIIEGGKIDGDVVFITDLAEYAGKIVAGCFAYEALNQHGEVHFIVDPYTKAKKNVTVFTLNADFSLTYLVSANNTKGAPFVVASAAAQ